MKLNTHSMIDEFEIEDTNKLASTPEGKLFIAILVRAIEDLDKELKTGQKLYMLNWFFSNSEVFDLACHVMGWHKDVFRRRLVDKIKTGIIIPDDGVTPRTLRRRELRRIMREAKIHGFKPTTLSMCIMLGKVRVEVERAKQMEKENEL